MLNESESRISRMLYKLTAELAMTMNIVAATHNISQNQLRELRATCIDEVKRTNGTYSLKGAVDNLQYSFKKQRAFSPKKRTFPPRGVVYP